ncbi:MAG: hypothetical protein CM15mP21_7910 [Hyphomicrobiales bacterium]|nr:MAG: hypothetical protein CM15mP21_7910 [Hyphomicrobiales bacterium]
MRALRDPETGCPGILNRLSVNRTHTLRKLYEVADAIETAIWHAKRRTG